jgi:hypothetical protein
MKRVKISEFNDSIGSFFGKKIVGIRLVVGCMMLHCQASLIQASEAMYLIQPSVALATICATTSGQTRNDLQLGLQNARRSVGEKLPAQVFELFEQSVAKASGPLNNSSELKKACNEFVGQLDKDFDKRLRYSATTILVLYPALACIALEPSNASEVQKELIAAYAAVGLPYLNLDDVVSAVGDIRAENKKIDSKIQTTSPQDCAENIKYLKQDFRKDFSETGFFKLLNGALR